MDGSEDHVDRPIPASTRAQSEDAAPPPEPHPAASYRAERARTRREEATNSTTSSSETRQEAFATQWQPQAEDEEFRQFRDWWQTRGNDNERQQWQHRGRQHREDDQDDDDARTNAWPPPIFDSSTELEDYFVRATI